MPDVLADLAAFRKDLTALVNKHNLDTVCRTPAYAVAEFMLTSMAGLMKAVMEHEKHQPGGFTRTPAVKPAPRKDQP